MTVTANGEPAPRVQLPHPQGMSEVGILDELMPAFEEWLHSRGLYLTLMPNEIEGANPFYAVGIEDELWRRTS